MQALGRHLLVEFYNCDHKVVNDVKTIEKIMVSATEITGAKIVDVIFHSFNPFGVSGVVVIAESHLAIHTWPEYNFASVDVYTCGQELDPWKAYDYLKEQLKASNVSVIEMKRGVLETQEKELKHKIALD